MVQLYFHLKYSLLCATTIAINGAMTLSMTTLSIMTLSIMTLDALIECVFMLSGTVKSFKMSVIMLIVFILNVLAPSSTLC
jgi:hypothetical protein